MSEPTDHDAPPLTVVPWSSIKVEGINDQLVDRRESENMRLRRALVEIRHKWPDSWAGKIADTALSDAESTPTTIATGPDTAH